MHTYHLLSPEQDNYEKTFFHIHLYMLQFNSSLYPLSRSTQATYIFCIYVLQTNTTYYRVIFLKVKN